MPVYRFPVLVWQDAEGHVSATPVEDFFPGDRPVAVADSTAAALKQLKAFLNWAYHEHPWLYEPDFVEPRLRHARIDIRPRYLEGERTYPCDHTVEVDVPYVEGRQEGGLLVCSLPTLDLFFHYHDASALKRLVAEAVRYRLTDLTPRQLSRLLPPGGLALEEIAVRLHAVKRTHSEPELATLRRVAEPIGQASFRKRFSGAWQREEMVERLGVQLGQQSAGVLLVGEPGVGKTTLLVAAARAVERITGKKGEAGAVTFRHRFWQTSAGRIVAGMKYLGQWQERCEALIAELAEIGGTLCVESLLELVLQGGREPSESIAAFLMPYLQTGELRLVAETTPAELDACYRLVPGVAQHFQLLRVPPLDGVQTRAALTELAAVQSRDTKVEFDPELPERVRRLFHRFMPYHASPGQAARFVVDLFETAQKDKRPRLSAGDAAGRFIRRTGLPERFLRDDQPLPLDEIVAHLAREVVGQDEACRTAARVIATFKAGLNDPQRPLGVLLFAGPTGVGKTQLTKAIARYLFGHGDDADRLVRLDMSEYSSPLAAERLIAQDSQTPSHFIRRMRQQPFAVVLLDEIEKAAPEVFDVLLGALDEGRLTDRFGRTTSFRSAIIVMTSNLGASHRQAIGFGGDASAAYDAEVRAFFRPEFFNRIDSVVVFQPLPRDVCRTITRMELEKIAAREGIAKGRLRLTLTDALVDHLVAAGFDPRLGARPLQRAIESLVVAPLARALVAHPGLRGEDVLVDIDERGEVIVIL